ncbi:Transcriptional activator FeaR [Pseudomonas sp. Bi70]|uniref:transcriptional regulator FeaR n=1 Tax=Pseudomonas sp. Bi70 TaxID=2821127 RepID=UPI001D278894|nr:transcriptional regulator FeaR [Pseudomonas sp. Bi70]CAH0142176.1 Transcriptional activator FeaR [Pseudomonas sp. Bi70]
MYAQQSGQSTLENWHNSMQSICGNYETRLAFNSSLFIGDAHAEEHGGFTLAHLKTNAGVISRTLNSDRDDDRYCFLVSQRSGCSRISHNGSTLQLTPGDLILMDSVGACEITPQGLIEHTSLHLPREQVLRCFNNERQLFGKVSSRNISGRMLRILVDELCSSEENTSSSEQEALLSTFTNLLRTALMQGGMEAEVADSVAGNSLRLQAQRLIEESLSQPNLTPVNLANRLQISLRQLYRLFEEQDDSVCRYIQRTRLQRSASDLANPNMRRESITSIAYKWGFTDSAHFSRAFKKQFEQSPKDYRTHAFGA